MNILKLMISLFLFGLTSWVYAAPPNNFSQKNVSDRVNYTFVFLYKNQNQRTMQLQKVFNESLSKLDNIRAINMNANESSAQPFIEKYKLERAPMPFVIVIASNGAVTGGFSSFTKQQLTGSIVSVGTANCLKALQTNKLVVLYLKNNKTAHNQDVSHTINSFKTDPRFSKATQVVVIDPSDNRELSFLNQLRVNPNINEATTLLIAPPATVIGKFQGAITKDQLVASIKKATSGYCNGKCSSGHCNCHGGDLS